MSRTNACWLSCVALAIGLSHATPCIADESPALESGEVAFLPTAGEANVPERFRLASHRFDWHGRRMQTENELFDVWDVTFPSPVVSPEPLNNVVHCEYYQSRQAGRQPAVIVLHILGGDFPLARLFCNVLAQHGVQACFLKMPYYGPRRDPNSKRRMVSVDPAQTAEGLTQAVLDIRRATAWLASRPEVDDTQLGIFGISLGGITAALAMGVEPRLEQACLLLAGGGIAEAGWDAPQTSAVREQWFAQGRTREEYVEALRVVDPVTYAANARGKRILMLNATSDEVIPRRCTLQLWEALGEPEIRWLNGGHYSVIRHLPTALLIVPHFFADKTREKAKR